MSIDTAAGRGPRRFRMLREHRSVRTNTDSWVCGQPGVGGGDEGNIEHPFAGFKICCYMSIPYFQLNRNCKPDSFKLQTLSSDSVNGGGDFQGCPHEGSDTGTDWGTAGADQEATSPAQPLGEGSVTWLWRREDTRLCPGFTVYSKPRGVL